MKETFPEKKAGDKLGAGHINDISRVCRNLDAGGMGSHGSGFFGNFNGTVPSNSQIIVDVEITSSGPFTHDANVRYYDHTAGVWRTDFRTTWLLDAAGNFFAEGQVVTAYWHAQRRAFMPLSREQSVLKIGDAEEDILAGDFGFVRIWLNGQPVEGDDGLVIAQHDWITQDLDIQQGDQVIIGWFFEEGQWRIIGADCPKT